MPPDDLKCEAVDVGDFSALFNQLDGAALTGDIDGGYAKLISRLNSAEYRRRCGLAPN